MLCILEILWGSVSRAAALNSCPLMPRLVCVGAAGPLEEVQWSREDLFGPVYSL